MPWKKSTKQKRQSQAAAQGIKILNEPDTRQGNVRVQYTSCSHERFVAEVQITQSTIGKCPTCRALQNRSDLLSQAKAITQGAQLKPVTVTV